MLRVSATGITSCFSDDFPHGFGNAGPSSAMTGCSEDGADAADAWETNVREGHNVSSRERNSE